MFSLFSDILILMNYCKSWLHCFWVELLLSSCFETAGLVWGKIAKFLKDSTDIYDIIFQSFDLEVLKI